MKTPPGDGDNLVGSPELFATNLLLVRAIEHDMNRVTIRRTDEGIRVQNHHDDQQYDPEILTEDLSKWTEIRDRFEAMTEFDDDRSGTLKPSTPAVDNIDHIGVEYPDEETIEIYFRDA